MFSNNRPFLNILAGTVIKDYIQAPEGLRKDISQIYPEVSDLILKDKGLGSTIVKFKRR